MIPNTPLYYIFIRVCIWTLRSIAPLSTIYCLVRYLGYKSPIALPRPLEILVYTEVFFYFLVSFPKQWYLNKCRPRVTRRSREQREELFERCWASIPDLEAFLSVWFKGASLDSIHRQDLKDFLAWGFLCESTASRANDDELEQYVHRTEKSLGRTFRPGRGPNRPSRVSIDVLRLQHKPLLFYVGAVGTDDLMTYLTAQWIGLRHFRLPLRNFFLVFPFRPHTLFSWHVSTSENLSYWYRPHTSKKRKPVLLIHGIGAGMRTYTGFLNDFMQRDALLETDNDDGQVGIIAIELMPVAMRITKGILPRAEMLTEILKILAFHDWDKYVIVGHSYGTILATHLLQHIEGTGRTVGPLLLVDPVTISIHWGGIPYNFLYRRPCKASEWQLHYFACTDMCVAHSITRRFDWSKNVLWKEDMRGRVVTVALADDDIVMDTFALREYLLDDKALNTRMYDAKELSRRKSIGRYYQQAGKEEYEKGVDIVWYEGLNHAEIWDSPKDWKPLVDILHRYCGMMW